ncbi:LysR family transcriptional regulator [Ferruginibacter lapsinanis]|uniref:LysR substrate-binding domain-containing protein n=1 Tax=Ferruginibacter lapsinanis TaxID=563172 RepID=UPI001E54CEC0|nr:LysR substrate-binding domain-containing protein [Ferruginibacter lapsinanis]UEG50992.1 LysR family transcriptional regulator [Ferruginibacter lapsinanis]
MELRQLRYFIRSAELLNFTEAAGTLYISQSTLSQQIKQLEDELGIPLFDRIGKRVHLTEAGNLFLPYARQSLVDAESGRFVIDDLKGLKIGELRIGVTYGLSAVLTPVLLQFSELYPDIKIIVEFGTSEDMLDKLKSTKVDFLLSFLELQDNEKFISQRLYDSPLALAVHPSNILSKKASINIKDLKDIPLVLPSTGFHTRHFLNEALAKNNIQPNIKMELNDINVLLQLVETGNWCTVMTVAAVKGRHTLKAIPVKGLNIVSQASITWPKESYRKKAALVFTEMIKKQMK